MNDSTKYFFSRVLELLHKKAFDSYRVSLHNPYTIFIELEKSIERFNNNSIKHFDPTISSIGEEAITYLENKFIDQIFRFGSFTKSLIIKKIKESCGKESKDGRNNRTLSLICKTICYDNSNFKLLLLERISELLAADDSAEYPKLDTYASWLISQLLFEGFSRKYILDRIRFSQTKIKNSTSILDAFNHLSLMFSNESEDYEVIFKLKKNDSGAMNIASMLISSISDFPTEFVSNRYINDKFKEKAEGEAYFLVTIQSNDFWSALKRAHQVISETIEINALHDSQIKISLENQALVIHSNSRRIRMEPIHEELDGFYNYQEQEFDKFIDNYKNIPEKSVAREKIRSAIRFYKLGNESLDIEHKILNYWIGFEQLFASPENNEDSIKRIKSFFIPINTVFYWQRRANYLIATINRGGGNINIHDITPNYSSAVINPLIDSRLTKYKNDLNNRSKLKASLELHKKRLEHHLTRIYRVRNELVHEGSSSVDLFLIAGHLRHYLIFSIEQLTNELIENPTLNTIEDVFVYFENMLTMIEATNNIHEIFVVKNYKGYME